MCANKIRLPLRSSRRICRVRFAISSIHSRGRVIHPAAERAESIRREQWTEKPAFDSAHQRRKSTEPRIFGFHVVECLNDGHDYLSRDFIYFSPQTPRDNYAHVIQIVLYTSRPLTTREGSYLQCFDIARNCLLISILCLLYTDSVRRICTSQRLLFQLIILYINMIF